MRYIAAYLLLQTGGNVNPSAADIKKLLAVAGVEADSDRLNKLISELKGKSISDLIAEGSGKLASVPSGGDAVSSGPATGGGGGGAAPVVEEKEEKVEEKEESDDDMGFGLFD